MRVTDYDSVALNETRNLELKLIGKEKFKVLSESEPQNVLGNIETKSYQSEVGPFTTEKASNNFGDSTEYIPSNSPDKEAFLNAFYGERIVLSRQVERDENIKVKPTYQKRAEAQK